VLSRDLSTVHYQLSRILGFRHWLGNCHTSGALVLSRLVKVILIAVMQTGPPQISRWRASMRVTDHVSWTYFASVVASKQDAASI
jgi:hypothetical protein